MDNALFISSIIRRIEFLSSKHCFGSNALRSNNLHCTILNLLNKLCKNVTFQLQTLHASIHRLLRKSDPRFSHSARRAKILLIHNPSRRHKRISRPPSLFRETYIYIKPASEISGTFGSRTRLHLLCSGRSKPL